MDATDFHAAPGDDHTCAGCFAPDGELALRASDFSCRGLNRELFLGSLGHHLHKDFAGDQVDLPRCG
jgi:hypothetical protein